MMTMEKVKAQKARLAELEQKLIHLDRIDKLNHMLSEEQFMISATKVDGAFTNSPVHISLVLTDAEQTVLAKSIMVVLEFARQRIEKEIENA